MLDVGMSSIMQAMLAETLQNHVSVLRSFKWVDEWILSPRKVILLDINKEEGSFHRHILKYSRT
jgi:hypothetical protein